MRWYDKVTCPYKECDNKKYKCYNVQGGKFFKCDFSIRTGTIFEESGMSMRKWFIAI